MKPFTTSRRLAAACALACLLAAGTTAHAAAPAADVPAEAAAPPADPPPAPNTPELSPTQFQGVILEIGVQKGAKAANFDQLTLQPDGPYQPVTLPVARPEDKLALQAGARKGDRIWVNVDDPVNPTRIVGISRIARPVATPVLIGAVAGVVVLLGLFVSLATRGRPQRFLVGHDGRLSNSQCQLALWFGVVAVAYGATLVLRYQVLGPDFIGGIGLTTNVLALTGLSALTFGGAKIVSTQKQDAASDAAAETATTAASVAETAANIASTTAAVAGVPTDNPVIASTASAAAANAAGAAAVATANAAAAALAATNTPPAAAQPSAATTGVKASIRDLFQNDQGDADLGDFQMILISLVAAGIFLWSSLLFMSVLDVVKTTTLPDIDTTLLGTFGLGQGAYLIKKAALPAGQG